MIENTKWYLFYLIEQVSKHEMDLDLFCSEIYRCYGKSSEHLKLTSEEDEVFSKIEVVTSRFSSSEYDHQNHPDTFTAEKDLYEVNKYALETLKLLNPQTS